MHQQEEYQEKSRQAHNQFLPYGRGEQITHKKHYLLIDISGNDGQI